MSTYIIWRQNNNNIYLGKQFWNEKTFWGDGYFNCSIGNVSKEIIEKYIQSKHICENGPTNGALMYNFRPEVTRRFWDDSDNTVIDGVIAAYRYTIRNRTI